MGAAKSKNTFIHFPEVILEQLRCSLCKSYLSCSPLRSLPDGSSICGRCSPTVDGAPIYRQLALELALSKTIFPCCYKAYGCTSQLSFGHATEHEGSCGYKPIVCPSLPFTSCSWLGSVAQVCSHFMEVHAELTTLFGQFLLDIDKDRQQILMVIKDFVPFMIKFRYDGSTTTLRYDIRYFATTPLEATYKIKLVNNFNSDLNINLKQNKCDAFIPGISEMQSLTINKYLNVLENPNSVKVEINITIKTLIRTIAKAQQLINYQLLETLRCEECQNYLTLPTFDSPKGVICCDCAENYTTCTPSTSAELRKLITETNYPCRWHNCKFIGKGYYIRRHELVCLHYPYDCPAPACKSTLTLAQHKSMGFHLMFCHGYEYFSQCVAYRSIFTFNSEKVLVTTKNNEILLIKHRVNSYTNWSAHIFSLHTFKPGVNRIISIQIHFEHTHCKLKSKTFLLDNKMNLNITADKLPKCFNITEKMTVIIEA